MGNRVTTAEKVLVVTLDSSDRSDRKVKRRSVDSKAIWVIQASVAYAGTMVAMVRYAVLLHFNWMKLNVKGTCKNDDHSFFSMFKGAPGPKGEEGDAGAIYEGMWMEKKKN